MYCRAVWLLVIPVPARDNCKAFFAHSQHNNIRIRLSTGASSSRVLDRVHRNLKVIPTQWQRARWVQEAYELLGQVVWDDRRICVHESSDPPNEMYN
jgi:hypothetical protein